MFTIKGCSLIRGVHYERFHCITYIPIIDQILSTTIYTFKILIFALEGSQQIVGNFIFQELLNKLALQSKETKYKKLSATI